ncbi:vanillate O-demethylase oxidoreductase VanB [Qingshengfaniella alkalisoli]|uniref:Vanillate O-demethylase oxidoreductase VanB n=2 Tax=Qingshengfaniella alkalisoli TaxID=2599296 RepID=A0A5B8IAK3_9RHOB|nr:vanillate O-demethylase oxidoreductase VanB [Qingshengfaniella alkalisoli]
MTDTIEKSTIIDASVERVWQALTDHARFGDWFGAKMSGPFEPGKEVTFTMSSNDSGCENSEKGLSFAATIRDMEKPNRFSYTWHPYAVDPDHDYSREEPTLVEFRLEEVAEGTKLTVVESGFERIPEDRRDLALRKNTGGWEFQMERIKAYVEQNS